MTFAFFSDEERVPSAEDVGVKEVVVIPLTEAIVKNFVCSHYILLTVMLSQQAENKCAKQQ